MPFMKKNPLGKFRIPWFMIDLGNYTVITLPNVPLQVDSIKPINYAKTKSPGNEFEPIQFSNMGAQEINFEIKLANRNWMWGNVPILKLFENLRTPAESLLTMLFNNVSNANPQVMFWYGTGNMIPLIYFVQKCDFSHKAFTQMGYPTVTDITMSLILYEDSILYKAEKIARMVMMYVGMAEAVYNVVMSFLEERPY